MAKHLAILLATLAAFAFSLYMMQQVVGLASPWMVLMLFFCFLGLAKVAEPLYMLKLPPIFREVRPGESRLYDNLGVRQFAALLRNTPLRFLNTTVYVSRGRHDIGRIARQVASAEAIHFWGAIALLPYLGFCVLQGHWNALAAFVAVQILGNAYPVMHLRSVRGRLDRLLVRDVPLQLLHPRA